MAAPLFILAPGRSYTSLVSTMVGQHPQAFSLPELNLNVADTMEEWSLKSLGAGTHGLLRTVAQLHHGVQDPATIVDSRHWIRARQHWSTDMMYRELANKIAPRVIVEKSPRLVSDEKNLERLLRFFPEARFIHLTRHPRSTCKSVLKAAWAQRILASAEVKAFDYSTTPPTLDPQTLWYTAHMTIRRFMERLLPTRCLTVQGEAFLSEPDQQLRRVASWLGLSTDDASVEEMKHPERSPFARFGPPNAFAGNDPGFLRDPVFRPSRAQPQHLEGPLEWRFDGRGFLPQVKDLAHELGYA